MGMQEIITTLHDFLKRWLTDADFRDAYGGDVDAALEDHGFDDVDSATLLECLPLVAEDLPLSYQRGVYDYLESDVETGSYFDVDQSGGKVYVPGGGGGEGGASEVAKHIYKIHNVTNNNSYIDDRDVNTTINALGDVDFDQVIASGDGAVAGGGDVSGVNTGTNNGIIAGDDANGAEVRNTNVTGNGNTVTGDVGAGAVIVSGDDNVLAKDSNVIDGDFSGGVFAGDDIKDSTVAGGAQYNVDADNSAVNFGSGKNTNDQSTNIDVDIDDSFNTDNSVNTKDSFNTDNSVNIDDSFQDNDKIDDKDGIDVDIDDSFQDNDKIDDKDGIDVDDSFNKEIDIEESFNQDNDTKVETDIDVDVEIEESFNQDNDHIDADVAL